MSSAALPCPAVVLAADHRGRGVITTERYADYLASLRAALPGTDGILATAQPLADLVASGAVAPPARTYLSINRTGLAGSATELDDRLVAPVELAARKGYTGIKHMTRIDLGAPETPAALELLGTVLAEADALGLEALIEPLSWVKGAVDRTPDGIVYAAVIAHDLGAPIVKVPVPAVEPGHARADAVRRIVESVGVPVLFLGGPRPASRQALLRELGDAMAGGAAGVALGRAVYQDDDPALMSRLVTEVVRGVRPLEAILADVCS